MIHTIGGFTFSGKTMTEIRTKADALLTELLGSDTPTLVCWRGYAKLVFRNDGAWGSTIIAFPDVELESGRVRHGVSHPVTTNETGYLDALCGAVEHVAQLGFTLVTDSAEIAPELLQLVPERHRDGVARRHQMWARAQLALAAELDVRSLLLNK